MPLDRPGEIGQFLRVIGEGVDARPLLELKFRSVGRNVLEYDAVLDAEAWVSRQSRRWRRNCRKHRGSSEAGAAGIDVEACIQQPLVVAVARTQHHPVLAKPNRGGIGVSREMPHRQDSHAAPIEFRSPL